METEINEQTKRLIHKRMENLKKGKKLSTNELILGLRKKLNKNKTEP